ncbi:MAG: hypothetical protein LUQ50_10050 [Methanospirillum sp.]|uniref:Sjogren's syndrome/scleroderma autoantigen 1 family protein n=1 Tax=Methanospirillum sp. TaxID=45200 RepID=UPI002374F2C9|nr:Sjogren's syndrome/scleroderma autoantigen 1 family protein [Methanospirillum sp.]MDD1729399.1 hypothetical protein [Methanospirillum sp.]
MRKPDEIMAEYLLKGGKMLAKPCPDCGSPLFEYKGETSCVVCKETNPTVEAEKVMEAPVAPLVGVSATTSTRTTNPLPAGELDERFVCTLKSLLTRIEEENDTRRLTKLTRALRDVSEAYAMISPGYQGYGNRESS